MQDAASTHASLLGVGFSDLQVLNRTFILSRLQIKIDGPLPTWGEQIELKTWPRSLNRLFALRDFEIRSGEGSPFLKATTAWLLINTEQRRPVRPHDQLLKLTPRKVCALEENMPNKLTWESNTELQEIRSARASDLDPNAHVNNSRYIDWITDAIAQKYGLGAEISETCVNFLSEIQLNQQVSIGIKEHSSQIVTIQGGTDHRNFSAKVHLS
jgi:medium-chain acyl-[acyl-carrier-protein] hydrolase